MTRCSPLVLRQPKTGLINGGPTLRGLPGGEGGGDEAKQKLGLSS